MHDLTLKKLLLDTYQNRKNKNYVYERNMNVFTPKTFDNLVEDVFKLSKYLLDNGYKGKKIAIYAYNSYEWIVSDLAVMTFVGVSVPINNEWNAHDLNNIFNYIDIDLMFYSKNNEAEVHKLLKTHPHLTLVCIEEDFYNYLDDEVDFNLEQSKLHEVVKIICSSGSTALPKASMLTHKNLFSGYKSFSKRTKLREDDRCYLFLPMYHTYGGINNVLFTLIAGTPLYLCSNKRLMLEELQIVKPTILCVVPLVLESLYREIDDDMKRIMRGLKLSKSLNKIKLDIRERLFSNIHNLLGGELRHLYVGGAALNRELKQFFIDLGFPLLEAFASTETSCSLALTYPKDKNTKSVGTIYEDVDVIIKNSKQGIGEIWVKGDNVFEGYYKMPELNEKHFDKEGYFNTEDVGFIDKKRRLYFVKRKKRVIVRSNGKNIYPDELEQNLELYQGINKAKVYEHEELIKAFLYVEKEGIYDEIVAEFNMTLPKYKQIQEFNIIIDSLDTRLK